MKSMPVKSVAADIPQSSGTELRESIATISQADRLGKKKVAACKSIDITKVNAENAILMQSEQLKTGEKIDKSAEEEICMKMRQKLKHLS